MNVKEVHLTAEQALAQIQAGATMMRYERLVAMNGQQVGGGWGNVAVRDDSNPRVVLGQLLMDLWFPRGVIIGGILETGNGVTKHTVILHDPFDRVAE